MNKNIFLLLLILLSLFSCKDQYSNLPDGLYAAIKTSKGDIILLLEYEKTPITVANFITLAEGKNTFVNDEFKNKPFYNGLKFHRVLKDFMIQGGDPLGNGSGDTGYKFKDEFTDLVHDNGGILSMANSGPGTNSSQFFITHLATPWLNGKHTVFGHVVEKGMEVVNKIEQDDTIISISIIRKGENAKKFNGVKVFNDYFNTETEKIKKSAITNAENKKVYEEKFKEVLNNKVNYFNESKAQSIKTSSGLMYKIIKKGNGLKPVIGSNIFLHYAGFFENGLLFDTSVENIAKEFGKYDENRAAQNGYMPIPFQAGRKEGLIAGFLEGIELLSFGDKIILFIPSNLAYGESGYANGLIPPNSNLIFELELLKK